jgi:hypothetical protein
MTDQAGPLISEGTRLIKSVSASSKTATIADVT